MDRKSPRIAGPRPPEPPRIASSGASPTQRARAPRAARALRRVALGLALLAAPGAALAAVTVKGRAVGTAKLLNPVWNEAKDPKANRYTFREPSATVRADVRTLVGFLPKELCIAALSDKGTAKKEAVRVIVSGGRTTPVTLVVPEGQQILFENQDPFPHKLYDLGNKGLQAVETAASKSRTWTPSAPGKYEIRDQLAPSVRSWVVVEPRVAAAGYPDRSGSFAIELEPGKYTLQGYYNGEAVGSPVEIVAKPTPTEQLIPTPVPVGEAGDAGVEK